MFKKISLSFLALVVFVFPISQLFQQNQAYAIATKVATKVATEAVKEVIKDSSKQMIFDMVLDTSKEIKGTSYVQKEGYMSFCMDYTYKPGDKCQKPVQVKKDITKADTDKLDDAVGKQMDSKIGGVLYSTKWGKFLDWVVPIYAISGVTVAIDYAINQEDSILGMMNEIAMEALQDAGLIENAVTVEPVIVDGSGNPMFAPETKTVVRSSDATVTESTYAQSYEIYFRNNGFANPQMHKIKTPTSGGFVALHERSVKVKDARVANNATYRHVAQGTTGEEAWPSFFNISNGKLILSKPSTYADFEVFKNDVKMVEKMTNNVMNNQTFEIVSPDIVASPVVRSYYKMPRTNSGIVGKVNEQTNIHILENGDKYTVKYYMEPNHVIWNTYVQIKEVVPAVTGQEIANKVSFYEGGSFSFTPFVPKWSEEIQEMQELPSDLTIFRKNETTIILPPAASMTYTDTATGTPLQHTKDPTTGETGFALPDGTPVHEDGITVSPGTGFTPSPEGTPDGFTYTPGNPSPENPTQTPETVVKNPIEPETPPGGSEPPPPGPGEPGTNEPLPEGASCEEKFKFPIFSPLKEVFSTSFPFSIPWDIGRAIEAAFGDIGSEKPEYEIKIDTAGINQTFKITTPAFFDKWKPFTDSLLVFTFDVLIMFGIFRFVKGAGS